MISPPSLLRAYALVVLAAIPQTSHGNEYSMDAPPALQRMPPDNWGGAKAHVGISAAIGVASRAFIADPVYAWGACMIPGLYREVNTYYRHPEPGYRHGLLSRRDLVSNGVGCLAGVTIGGVAFAPGRVWFNKEF
jgi:hypothetical protein